jgi:hypothetical protein
MNSLAARLAAHPHRQWSWLLSNRTIQFTKEALESEKKALMENYLEVFLYVL